MINSIYAAEFDLIKGCIVKATYPENQHDDSLLASYMIPDGVHKVKRDYFFFKLGQHQLKEGRVRTFHFDGKWLPLFKSEEQMLTYVDDNIIKITTDNQQEWLDINLHNVGVQFVANDFVVIELNPHLKYGLMCDWVEQTFLTVLRNKKDPTIKRGSLIRSISIQANELLYVGVVHNMLEDVLNEYFETIGIEHWDSETYEVTNKAKLTELLQRSYNRLNGQDLHMSYYKFSNELIDYNPKDWVNLFEKRCDGISQQASVIELLKTFKMKTRILYRAILQQKRILFLSHECSNSNKTINEEIYSKACNLASAMMYLVMPLNIKHNIQGYKSLMDPMWDGEGGKLICIVSNPIFEYRKEWWDLLCDINTARIVESPTDSSVFVNNEQDVDFFQNLLNLVNESHLAEQQVRQILYKYTTHVLQSEGTQQYLEYKEYRQLQTRQIFTEREAISIQSAINIMKLQRDLDDIELQQFYQTLLNILKNENQMKYFMKLYLSEGCSINQLGCGILSSDVGVNKLCKQLMKLIDSFDRSILKRMNIMMLL